MRDVGGQRLVADLDRGAVEADVGDVMLAASVRAAAHLHVHRPRQRVGDLQRLDPLLDGLVEAHRAGDPELAGVGAGAADHVGDLVGTGVAEVERRQRAPHLIDRLVAHPAQHEVLMDRGPGRAAGVVTHDLAQAAQLLGAEVAAADLDLDGAEAGLALGGDVGLGEAIELAAVTVGAGELAAGLGRGAPPRRCRSGSRRSRSRARRPSRPRAPPRPARGRRRCRSCRPAP